VDSYDSSAYFGRLARNVGLKAVAFWIECLERRLDGREDGEEKRK
jgi:hypothetical protein